MSFVNDYQPPAPPTPVTTSEGPYDINFVFATPAVLETDRVKLVPFIPSLHAEPYFYPSIADPELSRYLPVTFTELSEYLIFVEYWFRRESSNMLFAIIDKTKQTAGDDDAESLKNSVAGMIGLIHASPRDHLIEIGPVVVLPAFQRTFVTTHAVSILLRYCLDLAPSGLGLRRVQWGANPYNKASIRVAERFKMKLEGTTRWSWALKSDKIGNKVGEGRGEGLGRDSVVYAVCWDDWENGVREHVDRMVERI